MIRIKHIAPDGRVTTAVDLTPDSTDADVAAAHATIDGLVAEDKATHNTLGIVAKRLTEEEQAAATAAAEGTA